MGRSLDRIRQLSRTPENLQALDQIELYANSFPESRVKERRDRTVALRWRRVLIRTSVMSYVLRPEATASVVRAYIEHGMHALPGNQKLYYIGPMFRRERPQKGRYRQFYQIGAEVLGQSDAPAIDAEILEMLLVFFARVGLTKTTLYVNSIGCKDCRPKYVELLREELRKVKDQLEARQPAPHRDESAARARFEAARRAADHRKAAAHLRPSLRRLPRPFREAERRTQIARNRVRRKLAAGSRPRLLHAHHI